MRYLEFMSGNINVRSNIKLLSTTKFEEHHLQLLSKKLWGTGMWPRFSCPGLLVKTWSITGWFDWLIISNKQLYFSLGGSNPCQQLQHGDCPSATGKFSFPVWAGKSMDSSNKRDFPPWPLPDRQTMKTLIRNSFYFSFTFHRRIPEAGGSRQGGDRWCLFVIRAAGAQEVLSALSCPALVRRGETKTNIITSHSPS